MEEGVLRSEARDRELSPEQVRDRSAQLGLSDADVEELVGSKN